ncbi:MAG TPA: hypothetical protein VNP72_05740, partial [Longimicrobium sp.]|nr:hypothetical protein [Longimicrobium sp.]
YNSVLPLSPVPLALLLGWLQEKEMRLARLLGEGQLAFYATLMSASTLGDVVRRGSPADLGLVLAGSLTIMILSTIVYSVAVLNHAPTRRNGRGPRRERRTSIASSVLAVCTTVMAVYFRVKAGLL